MKGIHPSGCMHGILNNYYYNMDGQECGSTAEVDFLIPFRDWSRQSLEEVMINSGWQYVKKPDCLCHFLYIFAHHAVSSPVALDSNNSQLIQQGVVGVFMLSY